MIRSPTDRRAAAAAGAVVAPLALAAYATVGEPRRLVVRRETLRLGALAARHDGLRVALVSDLHAGALHVRERALRRVVGRANRERPDLVLLLGDFVDPEA